MDPLWTRGWWLVGLSAAGGLGSIVALVARRFGLARVFAAMAVASVLCGWGVAAYPYLLPRA